VPDPARMTLTADLPATARALEGFLVRGRDRRPLERRARADGTVTGNVVPASERSLAVQRQALAARG